MVPQEEVTVRPYRIAITPDVYQVLQEVPIVSIAMGLHDEVKNAYRHYGLDHFVFKSNPVEVETCLKEKLKLKPHDTVCILDGDKGLSMMLLHRLQSCGFDAWYIENPIEMIPFLRQHSIIPKAILVGHDLTHEVNGLELVRYIRGCSAF